MPSFQLVGQRKPVINRTLHVWRKLDSGRYKCVICGGLSSKPSDDCTVDAVESLTSEERAMCPQRPER